MITDSLRSVFSLCIILIELNNLFFVVRHKHTNSCTLFLMLHIFESDQWKWTHVLYNSCSAWQIIPQQCADVWHHITWLDSTQIASILITHMFVSILTHIYRGHLSINSCWWNSSTLERNWIQIKFWRKAPS